VEVTRHCNREIHAPTKLTVKVMEVRTWVCSGGTWTATTFKENWIQPVETKYLRYGYNYRKGSYRITV